MHSNSASLRAIAVALVAVALAIGARGQEAPPAPQAASGVARIGEKPIAEWLDAWRAAAPDVRDRIADGLMPELDLNPNRAAIAPIFELLKSTDAATREAACALLRSDFDDSAAIGPALLPLLGDPDVQVRFRAATTLTNVTHPRPKAAYDLLLEFAQGDDLQLRRKAVRHLAGHVRVDSRIVDLLLDLVIEGEELEDVELRRVVVDGLAISDEERAKVALRRFLHDGDELVRVRVAINLALEHPEDDEIAAVLLELVVSKNDYVRAATCNALGQLGFERAADVAPALITAMHDPESGVRYQAAAALGVLGNDGAELPDAVPGLVELVKDENPMVRGAAAFALGHVGATTEVAVPAIATLIQDANDETRSLALDSLKQAGAEVVLALPQLIAALDDPKPVTRAWVAQLIALGGARAKEAVAPLTRRLFDPNLLARTWCAYALREIGGASASATPQLVKSLAEDPEPKMRIEAARTLAAIGPLAGSAADALVAACKDPDVDVRLWSLFALGELGVRSDAVLAELKAAAASTDARVLAEANKALAKFGEAHDAAAIANAPGGAPALLEPVVAVITYGGSALILSDAKGAAIVAFFKEFGDVEGKTQRRGVHYRFRYLAKGQAEATIGEDEVREVSRETKRQGSLVNFESDSAASRIDITAGPLNVAWSFLAAGSGFLYWRPETLRVELGNSGDFDSIDLNRFIR